MKSLGLTIIEFMVPGLGLKSLGFIGFKSLAFWVQGWGVFREELRVLGFRVQGVAFELQGSGVRRKGSVIQGH